MASETDSLLIGEQNAPTRSNRIRLSNGCLLWISTIALMACIVLIASGDWFEDSFSLFHRPSVTRSPAEGDQWNQNKYDATQFVSFTINTLGGLAQHGECEGRLVDPSSGTCYLGNANNITEDAIHRLKIFQQVLNRIQQDRFAESPDIDHSSRVLKIVMIPEFYFRGPLGAYSTTQMFEDKIILQVADQIRDWIASDIFEHYLFVLGTVIAARSPTSPDMTWWELKEPHSELEYFNFAPVYKGGSNHSHHYVITKHYISGADFLDRTSLPNPKRSSIHSYASFTDQLEGILQQRGTTIIDNNMISVDGLLIGIEICLDHRLGVLWDTLQQENPDDPQFVDILLIVSAGMAIERGPNPVIPGGVVYLTDGEASSSACKRADDGSLFDPDTVCREDIAGLKHIPNGGVGYSDFFPLTACIDIENFSLLPGYFSMFQSQGCAYTLKLYGIDVMDEFKYYPPSIEIYPTVDLPK